MSDLVKVQTYLQTIDEVIEKGPFKDNWESLSRYGIPEWGMHRQNSACSSTGGSTPCLPISMNGIRAKCTKKAIRPAYII